jgi:hypothetical protein
MVVVGHRWSEAVRRPDVGPKVIGPWVLSGEAEPWRAIFVEVHRARNRSKGRDSQTSAA